MPKSTMRTINNNKNKINNKIILIFILILTHNDDGILMVFVIATVLTWHLDYCTCHTDQDSNFSSNLLLNKKEKKKKKKRKKDTNLSCTNRSNLPSATLGSSPILIMTKIHLA